MTQSPPLEIVSAYQDAWTSGDFEAARRFIADQIVFRSPQQHIEGAEQFFAMLSGFVPRIQPRWEMLAATVGDGGVLVMYDLFTGAGSRATCADFFTLEDGRITSETLVFDPGPFAAAQSPTGG